MAKGENSANSKTSAVKVDDEVASDANSPSNSSVLSDSGSCSSYCYANSGFNSDGGHYYRVKYCVNKKTGEATGSPMYSRSSTASEYDDDSIESSGSDDSEAEVEAEPEPDSDLELPSEEQLRDLSASLARAELVLESQYMYQLVNEDRSRLYVDFLCIRAIERYLSDATYQARQSAALKRLRSGSITVSISWATRPSLWGHQALTVDGPRGASTGSIRDLCGLGEIVTTDQAKRTMQALAGSIAGKRVSIGGLKGLFESCKETGDRVFKYEGRKGETVQPVASAGTQSDTGADDEAETERPKRARH